MANARARSSVSFDVCRAEMSSTSFITGTGLKKCSPATVKLLLAHLRHIRYTLCIYAHTDNPRRVRLAFLRRSRLTRQERRSRDLGNTDRAGIRRENCVWPEFLCERTEDLLLEGELL